MSAGLPQVLSRQIDRDFLTPGPIFSYFTFSSQYAVLVRTGQQ